MADAQQILIISGPTASGKSGLALQIAQERNTIIINADALQVYGEMRILTARPSVADEMLVPHVLYGHRSILSHYAVTDWLQDIKPVLEKAWQDKQLPIIVGGTGFYLHSLLHGLAPVPDVPEMIRDETMSLYDTLDHDAFREKLRAVDAQLAESIKPNDRQRLVRAMEVYRATGMPLSQWQQQPRQMIFPDLRSQSILLKPPRDILYTRINERFLQMMDQGALDEARAIEAINPDPTLPGCKALGLNPLRRYVRGEITLAKAIDIGQTTSRQYAKRQSTWINTQWVETERHKIQFIQNVEQPVSLNL
jgi:tRNA dimethylallyltransferase